MVHVAYCPYMSSLLTNDAMFGHRERFIKEREIGEKEELLGLAERLPETTVAPLGVIKDDTNMLLRYDVSFEDAGEISLDGNYIHNILHDKAAEKIYDSFFKNNEQESRNNNLLALECYRTEFPPVHIDITCPVPFKLGRDNVYALVKRYPVDNILICRNVYRGDSFNAIRRAGEDLEVVGDKEILRLKHFLATYKDDIRDLKSPDW